jgi:hypothetical protein
MPAVSQIGNRTPIPVPTERRSAHRTGSSKTQAEGEGGELHLKGESCTH